MKSADSADVEHEQLIKLFYSEPDDFGRFKKIKAARMPSISRHLLAHDHHMTVTLEQHHGCEVDLRVLQSQTDGHRYSRKIVLTRHLDQQVVMFGIVRLDLNMLTKPVRAAVENQDTPLGRILIAHDVLRVVKLVDLFEIVPGAELSGWLHGTHPVSTGEIPGGLNEMQQERTSRGKFNPVVCYGRTALIYCDGRPAIELLEIVSESPKDESKWIR